MKTNIKIISMLFSVLLLQGCASELADNLNPFAESPSTTLGVKSTDAILDQGAEGSGDIKARHALEVMGSYQRALTPQPTYPVIKPAEVRLMWVPDHLTKDGNMVPAHYYYLKVRDDHWAVQDAFDIDEQLDSGPSGGSSTPWVYKQRK